MILSIIVFGRAPGALAYQEQKAQKGECFNALVPLFEFECSIKTAYTLSGNLKLPECGS
jgi:hypothetical protein